MADGVGRAEDSMRRCVMEVVQRLRKFYSSNRISALDFNCPSSDRCKAAAVRDGGAFVATSEVEIGEHYLNSEPRILVVSLDPAEMKEPNPVRIVKTPRPKEELGATNRHWYRTHEGVKIIVETATGDVIAVNEGSLWFAHGRVLRCSANLPGGNQAPKEMFWSCTSYLQEEIEILAPHVIWTQGQLAYDALSWVARYVKARDSSLTQQGVRVIQYGNAPVTWVHTVHPSPRNCSNSKWEEVKNILGSVSLPTPSSNL